MTRLSGPPAQPPRHDTVSGMLSAAARHPSGVTFVGLREEEVRFSWAEVDGRARRAAGTLVSRGVRKGDRVAIVLRTEPAFLDAFFGALHAGAVPVPLYPPVRLGRMDEYVTTTARMLRVSGARAVVTSRTVARILGRAVEGAGAGLDLGVLDAADLASGQETAVPGRGS
ncbi:MAG: AMP-binding protein, partial [Deltaproteobacteria bacterium]|nr:AMP-binding protein [Deltaproteobacteria bacterium]